MYSVTKRRILAKLNNIFGKKVIALTKMIQFSYYVPNTLDKAYNRQYSVYHVHSFLL